MPPHPSTLRHACTALGGKGLYDVPQQELHRGVRVATSDTGPCSTGDTAATSAGEYGVMAYTVPAVANAGSKGRICQGVVPTCRGPSEPQTMGAGGHGPEQGQVI